MGKGYWAVPITFGAVLILGVLWDLLDGADDVPPWIRETDYGCD